MFTPCSESNSVYARGNRAATVDANNSYILVCFSTTAPDPQIQIEGGFKTDEIFVVSRRMQKHRSLHRQGAENEQGQGRLENHDFQDL